MITFCTNRFGKASRRRGTFIWLILGLLLVPLLLASPQTIAAQTTTITLSPDTFAIQGCEIVDVAVMINNVTDLYGADVLLQFNPNILEVVDMLDATEGIPNNLLIPPLLKTRDIYDNTLGTVRYAASQKNPTLPVSGSGNLLIVRFRAKASGLTVLNFTYTLLSDRNGTAIPATAFGGATIISPPAVPFALNIAALSGTTARVSWSPTIGIDTYNLYREASPYFTPTAPWQQLPPATPFYDDTLALGDVNTNNYYVVQGSCSNGFVSAPTNRVGEFDFPITPGT